MSLLTWASRAASRAPAHFASASASAAAAGRFSQVTAAQLRSVGVTLAQWRGMSSQAREKLFDKILIANRGEIACRVMRTCKKLGIRTVAVYSEPDKNSVHVGMADEAYCVGPAASSQSYLNIPNIMDVIRKTGAQAVHPGYGFLSENKTFQEQLQAAGIKFIGPGTHAITAMGDKISSKKIAKDAGVSIIPGFLGEVKTEEDVVRIANEIGYPVMVKASGGGGGKGMRVAYNDAEAKSGFQLSRAEALSSFGNDTMFIEKFIEEPRHIEIQILADSKGHALYLNERECSVQRRNQKVIEEAPSVFLDDATRRQMGEQAVALARAVGYESAGTCEFLVDKHRQFYFLEMNTRLQVEHPVTEQITGVDIVEQMIRIAAGHNLLPAKQSDITINGWALESRVYAEDPLRGFLPSIGNLKRYVEPSGEGVRVDSGVVEGSEISIHYDPMISKLITYGKDRTEALAFMRQALDSYVIRGVTHNINFLRSLCDHPRFIEGRLTTNFIPEEYPNGYKGAKLTTDDVDALVSAAVLVYEGRIRQRLSLEGQNKSFDAAAFIESETKNLVVSFGAGEDAKTFNIGLDNIVVDGNSRRLNLDVAGKKVSIASAYQRGQQVFAAEVNGKPYTLQVIASNDSSPRVTLSCAGTSFTLDVRTPRQNELLKYMPVQEAQDTSKLIVSPMPGAVFSIKVKVGEEVAPGQEVAVVEAMKMQNALRAENGGVVKAIKVKAGQTVTADQVLIEFE